VKKDYLWREWQRALELDRTLDAARSGPQVEAAEGEERELVGARSLATARWI
jgi:hypothetical protein